MKKHLARLLRDFRLGDKAVAAVEFALVMPIMLMLFLGSVDLSQGVTADRKLATVAGTLGDLVAQSKANLPSAQLEDYFAASEAVMTPFDGSKVSLLVAILQVNSDGSNVILQNRARNGATPLTDGMAYPLPPDMVDVAKGGFVIVAEAWYTYTPLVGYVVNNDIRLHKRFFYIPRFGDRIIIG